MKRHSYKKGLVSTRSIRGGFTLMEMLVVIGIISIVGSLSLFMDINSYRGSAARSEVNSIATAMQTARADAFNNINQKKHGVAFFPGGYKGYVIFEGDSYATRDTAKDVDIKASYDLILSATSPTEITFDQLSGNGSYSGDITFTDPNRDLAIVIQTNNEGRISW